MVATIRIEITGDAARAQRAADQTASSYEKFGKSMDELAVPAGVAAGAIGLLGKGAIDAASATQQSMGAIDAVFGASAGKVKEWAAASAQAVGLSESSYGQLASVAGASLKNMGMSQSEAADRTNELITLGADLAATYGGTTAEAVQALTAAFRGEADPAERLGLSLKQSTIEARLAAKGQQDLEGSALEAAKAAAIMELATEQAAGANGAFAREAGTVEGAQQRATAEWQNAMATLGAELLPAVTAVTAAFASFAQWVGENSTLVLTLVGIIGGLAAAVLAVNAAMMVASAAQAAWTAVQMIGKGATAAMTAVQWALNAAMAANPVMLVVLAIAALVAALLLLWNNCEGFRNFVLGMWEKIAAAATAAWSTVTDAVGAAWDWITDKVSAARDFIVGVWDAITNAASSAWEGVKNIVAGVWSWIVDKANAAGETMRGIWETIKSVGVACWNAIKGAVDALLWPFRAVKDAVQWLIDKLRQAWDWAVKVISKIPFVGGMLSSSESSVAAAPSLARAGALGAPRFGTATPGIVVNVSGALDPVAVARQINSVLERERRRTRGVAIA